MSRLAAFLRSIDPIDVLGLVALIVLAAGIAGQFSVYWAAIVVGGLLLVFAIALAAVRRSENP